MKKHNCGQCGQKDPEKFYGRKTNVCAECHNAYTTKKGKEKRQHALEVLGGKCYACLYNKFPESLDIHHTDRTVKDSKFHQMRGWSLERLDRELEHCVLLCRNCHSAYHAGHDIGWGNNLPR